MDIEPNDTSSFGLDPQGYFATGSVDPESSPESCVPLLSVLGPGRARGGVATRATDEVAAASWRSRMNRQVNITVKLLTSTESVTSRLFREADAYVPGDPLREKICQLHEPE